MFATVAIVIVVILVIALFALRLSRANSVERSISSYKRRLGTIAEVVEQTTQARPKPVVERFREQTTQATPEFRESEFRESEFRESESSELGLDKDEALDHPVEQGQDPHHVAGLPAELGGRVYVSKEGRLVFGDSSLAPVIPPKAPIYEEIPRRRANRRPASHARARSNRVRPLTIAAVLIVVIGAVVGTVLVRRPGTKGLASVTTTTPTINSVGTNPVSTHHSTSSTHHAKSSSHQSTTSSVQLLSSSETTATFSAPKGTYSVEVYVDGVSWFGFERNNTANGPWLAMSTLGGVNPTSYKVSMSGTLAIVVGAPSKLTKVLVNDQPLDLPAQRGNSYSIVLR